MNRERLLDLADKVLTIHSDNLNMKVIILLKATPRAVINKLKELGPQQSCGTAGCVIGHLPYFYPKDWEYIEGMYMIKVQRCGTIEDSTGYSKRLTLQVMAYFDLTYQETNYLFGADSYRHKVKPHEVARRILDFVNTQPNPVQLARLLQDVQSC